MSIPGGLLIFRRRQAAPARRSLPRGPGGRAGSRGWGPAAERESRAPIWPKLKLRGQGPGPVVCRKEAAQGDCADYLVGVGAARESTALFSIVAKSSQWISDVRFPPANPPPTALPFLELRALPPRLWPSLVTTPSKKQTTFSLRTIHFLKLPLSGGPRVLLRSAPPPWRALPLRPPRSRAPWASSGPTKQQDSGLGRWKGGKS